MPAPVTPVAQGTPELTAQGSITADTARARICSFIGPSGEGVLVSAADPLPTTGGGGGGGGGDATAANQVLEIAELTDINTALVGVATAANQATQITALQLLDNAVVAPAAAVPTGTFQVSGTDGTNARALKTDAAGELQVDVLTMPAITGSVSVSPAALTGTVTTFNSTTSAALLAANADRKGASIYVDAGSGPLHVLVGTGTASDSNKSLTILATGYFEIPEGVTQQITAIFGTAGTAHITEYE